MSYDFKKGLQKKYGISKKQNNDNQIFIYENLCEFYNNIEKNLRNKINAEKIVIKNKISEDKKTKTNQESETIGLLCAKIILLSYGINPLPNNKIINLLIDTKLKIFMKNFRWLTMKKSNKNLPEFLIFNKLYTKVFDHVDKTQNIDKIEDELLEVVLSEKFNIEKQLKGVNYIASYNTREFFIYIDHKDEKSEEQSGWKFHIGISPLEMAKGWNIIKDILFKYKVASFKFIVPEEELKDEQAGKQITVYMYNSPYIKENTWKKILFEIEQALSEANVKPSLPPKNNLQVDRRIKGSRYITYRNAKDSNGKYLSAKKVIKMYPNDQSLWYNPSQSQGDFLKDFDIKSYMEDKSDLKNFSKR